ncbi:MAG: rpe [Chlamydiales bacterium]|nr:rpe [Chlamydiales bacterium]
MSWQNSIKIAPSIFAADFGKLAEEAKRVEEAGADSLHVDIMDGHFVQNLTLGPRALAAINRATGLFLDVHIMVYNPFEYVERLVEAGADQITFHLEATEDVEDTLDYIRKCNVKAGLALCPETSINLALKYLPKCDNLLLMTVNPGFGGQAFLPEVLEKIQFVRQVTDQLKMREGGVYATTPEEEAQLAPFSIQVDGGINQETGRQCIEAGANVLVAGTYLFNQKDMASAIQRLRTP